MYLYGSRQQKFPVSGFTDRDSDGQCGGGKKRRSSAAERTHGSERDRRTKLRHTSRRGAERRQRKRRERLFGLAHRVGGDVRGMLCGRAADSHLSFPPFARRRHVDGPDAEQRRHFDNRRARLYAEAGRHYRCTVPVARLRRADSEAHNSDRRSDGRYRL